MAKNKIKKNRIKTIQAKISSLENDLLISHTFSVKKYDTDSKTYMECIDQKAYDEKNTELKKSELELGILKFTKYCTTQKHVQKLLSNYIACLNNKLDWFKTQRTIKAKNGEWILDYRKIHGMENFIKSESDSFQKDIDGRGAWIKSATLFMKKNKKVIIGILALFIISPIFAGIVVSTPSTDWLVTQNNEWIGFWGNFIGGIIGAIIGGVVAYKVAEYGFKSQRELDKQAKITELKINNLTKFIMIAIGAQQRLFLSRQYIRLTYKTVREKYKDQNGHETITFESIYEDITSAQQLIEKNRKEIYDYLEKYQVENEISRYLVGKYQDAIILAHEKILELLGEVDKFEALFAMCKAKNFSNQDTIGFESFDNGLAQLDQSYKEVDYLLHTIIVSLRNEISSELNLPTFSVEDKTDYIYQRFMS